MIQQPIDKQNQGALKLQRLWRAYTNRKIYKYYRDIISFKCKGDPAKLLKGINPSEGYLLETSSNCHVRFKLGGEYFPPVIYYKIFTSSNVIDINAFAPRDYAALPRDKSQDLLIVNILIINLSIRNKDGTCDVTIMGGALHKMFMKSDYIENSSARKVQYYHFNKEKRQDKTTKKAQIIRNRWLKEIYAGAKDTKLQQIKQKQQNRPEGEEQEQDMQLYDPQKHNKAKGSQLDDQNWDDDQYLERQIKNLLDWSDNLDYTEYAKYWFSLSTSEPSNTKFFHTMQSAQSGQNGFKTFLTDKK